MQEAYCNLHDKGYAHSIECWHDGMLAGGLYGIVLDRIFFGESMFTLKRDASKVALFELVRHALQAGIKLIDCQIRTDHLTALGAREVSRGDFQELLENYIRSMEPQKKWRLQKTNKEGIGSADACQEERRL